MEPLEASYPFLVILGKSKRGLSKQGLSPKGANWAQKGLFGGISAASPRFRGVGGGFPSICARPRASCRSDAEQFSEIHDLRLAEEEGRSNPIPVLRPEEVRLSIWSQYIEDPPPSPNKNGSYGVKVGLRMP